MCMTHTCGKISVYNNCTNKVVVQCIMPSFLMKKNLIEILLSSLIVRKKKNNSALSVYDIVLLFHLSNILCRKLGMVCCYLFGSKEYSFCLPSPQQPKNKIFILSQFSSTRNTNWCFSITHGA